MFLAYTKSSRRLREDVDTLNESCSSADTQIRRFHYIYTYIVCLIRPVFQSYVYIITYGQFALEYLGLMVRWCANGNYDHIYQAFRLKCDFLTLQPKHVLWVLKSTVH